MDIQVLFLPLWTLATLAGTVIGILAIRELRRNWRSLKDAPGRPYTLVLAAILRGNMVQQTGRLAMEILCWLVVYFALFGNAEQNRVILGLILVAYRVMHVGNTTAEYLSGIQRRQHSTRPVKETQQ